MSNINDWCDFFEKECQKEYYKLIFERIYKDIEIGERILPKVNDVFRAFNLTQIKDTKVVIVGQDCYHGEGQANGLAFSVNDGIKIPPSLRNIYKEIEAEYGTVHENGDLTEWANQGVFLINSILTVRLHEPASHKNYGWEILTDEAIKVLNENNNPKVFMLWGNYAKSKKRLITNQNHLVLESVHPSPFSAYNGFFGCNHFKLANEFLISNNLIPIKW